MSDIPEWVQQEIRRVRENNLTELDLSREWNDRRPALEHIPPEICELTRLKVLNLAGHKILEIPDTIQELSQLTQLGLSGQYTTIPEGLGKLSQLTLLFLDGRYETIPEELGRLTQLTQLGLSGQYTTIPEGLGKLSQLTQLYFSGQYTTIPEGLGKLSQLTLLSLDGRYETIPEELGRLTQLTQLFLDGRYETIPEELGKFTQLTQLGLSGQYTTIPEGLGKLSQLTELSLSGWYETIPEWIGRLSQLTQLVLFGQYTTIPEGLGKLSQLTLLSLNGNLETIPASVFGLRALSRLNMDNNNIRVIPPEILSMTNLRYLGLNANPIEVPPAEIVFRGDDYRFNANLEAIRDYYQSLQVEDEDHLYEAKLLILGEGGAGKTTLARKILDPDYELVHDEKSTQGIEVMRWDFPLDDGQTFRVNLWDFGGQEIYHATHQFFLTNRSLYAIVADSRKEDTDFNYWLNIVELLGGESPVLIVKNEKQDRQRQIGERQLRARFPNVAEVLPTNLATNRNLDWVRREIRHRIVGLSHVGTPLPRSWVAVREALEHDERNYITIEEYYAICEDCNLRNRSKQETIIDYLHDLGVCLHFRHDPVLKRFVILKPHWGTSAVYTVLDNKAVINNFGRFTRRQLDHIWLDESYNGMHDELLQLMMRFKLCYEIPGMANNYIAPQLLSENQPTYDWNEADNLHLRYKYDFMPKGLVTRLIVAMHRYIPDNLVWKTGVVIERNITRAEVIEHYHDSRIHIRVMGRDKKGLLAVIMYELEEIHASYHGLKYDPLIPCNCEQCSAATEPYFFRYEVLQRSLGKTEELQCQFSFEMVNAGRLLDDVMDRWQYQEQAERFGRVGFEKATIGTLNYYEAGSRGLQVTGDDSMAKKSSKAETNIKSVWGVGSFYLAVFIVVVGGLLVLANSLPFGTFVVVLMAAILFVSLIGIFELRSNEKLAQKPFTELLTLFIKQLPLFGNLLGQGQPQGNTAKTEEPDDS